MKAIIMAGGEGTRLRPLTSNCPKPMLPVVNRPMMEHILALLKKHGFSEIVVTVAYMANAIQSYFNDGKEFGVSISYVVENVPRGTAGSVLNARSMLDEKFLVISGDVVTDVNLRDLVAFHEEKKSMVTIGLARMENPVEFGVVVTDSEGRIDRFLEKPTWGQVFSDTVNTGIYVLEPEIFDYIDKDKAVDFSQDVFPVILAEDRPLYGKVLSGYWEDVGTLEAYLKTHGEILNGDIKLEFGGFEIKKGTFISENSHVDPSAKLSTKVLIGQNCNISKKAELKSNTILGANVRIGEGSIVENSIIQDNCFIGPNCVVRGAIIGRSCDIRNNCHIDEGAVVGDNCYIGAGAILEHGVKVYPNKVVESGAIVNTSVIYETRANRNIFGNLGVTGLANVDITPELALRLAMAWASSLPKGSSVTTSRDSSRAARVLKRALMVGLNAGGINVEDLEVASLPVTRFALRNSTNIGGLSVRLSGDDPDSVIIRLFNSEGLDIDEADQRKIERLYHREEFRRALAGEIGDIDFPPRVNELYTQELISKVDVNLIKQKRFKIVLDYSYGTASFVMNNVLSKLGAEVLAVNPYGSTIQAISADLEESSKNVSDLVKTSGANLGAVIDKDCEKLTLIDNEGRVFSDDKLLLAMVDLFSLGRATAIGVPVSASYQVEKLANQKQVKVIRTKLSAPHLMEVALKNEVQFAASTWGGYIISEFLPAFDAIAAFVYLLDSLAGNSLRLSDLYNDVPDVSIYHVEVPTVWESRGAIMRHLVENPPFDCEIEQIDGVKLIMGDAWALVLPDPVRPVCHIWAESTGNPRDIAERLKAHINQIPH
jgi:mannose-1-phosphate guanylyltransferase/phosphomannomutase